MPAIDGGNVAVKLAELLFALGLRTTKSEDIAYPIANPSTGSLSRFAVKPPA